MVFGKLVVEELDIDSWGALQRDYRISNGMELTQEDSVIVQRFMHDLGGKCTKPRWAEKLLKWAAWEACGLEVEAGQFGQRTCAHVCTPLAWGLPPTTLGPPAVVAGTKTTKKKTFGELKSEFYGQADKAPIPGFEGQPLSRHGCLHHGVTPDYTVLLDKTEELICVSELHGQAHVRVCSLGQPCRPSGLSALPMPLRRGVWSASSAA